MTRHRYTGNLGRRRAASQEQVIADAGEGDGALQDRARRDNASRLAQAIGELLTDLGLLSNPTSAYPNNSTFWFRAFFLLAKRHVPAIRALVIPGQPGRPRAPEIEAEADLANADVGARRARNMSLSARCVEIAQQQLGSDATSAAVRQLASRLRYQHYNRRRGPRL